jgi:hypothetical protein
MTHIRKAFLGQAWAVPCRSCGKRVSVHLAGIVVALPLAAGVLLAIYFGPSSVGIVSFALGAIVMLAIHAFMVPLVRRDI